jgi:hypothetical protein
MFMQPSEKPIHVESQAHDRYADLVDKRFRSSLSEAEQAELSRLWVYLDEIETTFYEPIERKLESVLTKLRQQPLKR